MLDLPDTDTAMPVMPSPTALIRSEAEVYPPTFEATFSRALLSETSSSEATRSETDEFSSQVSSSSGTLSAARMQTWLSQTLAPRSTLAAAFSPTVELATVTPLSLAALLEPFMAFVQPQLEDPDTSVELAVSVMPAQPSVEPVLSPVDPGLQNWAAIADVRVVPAREDLLSPPLAGLAACTVAHAVPTDAAQASKLRHQVWFQNTHVADFESPEQAEATAQQLRQWRQSGLKGEEVLPLLDGGRPLVKIDDDTVMPITATMAEALGHDPAWVAVAIANNLRRALGVAELDASAVQMAFDQLATAEQSLRGTASWYGPYFHGRITATGETFNQYDLTAAHKTLPFGTRLKVSNVNNGRTVVVRINDRGPYIGDRSLDLSKAAAQCLGGEHVGLMTYEALILQDAETLIGDDDEAVVASLTTQDPALDQN